MRRVLLAFGVAFLCNCGTSNTTEPGRYSCFDGEVPCSCPNTCTMDGCCDRFQCEGPCSTYRCKVFDGRGQVVLCYPASTDAPDLAQTDEPVDTAQPVDQCVDGGCG